MVIETPLINETASAILQLFIIGVTALIDYWLWFRETEDFPRWIGFFTVSLTPVKSIVIILVAFGVCSALTGYSIYMTGGMTLSGFVYDSYRLDGFGLQTILTIFLGYNPNGTDRGDTL